MSKREAEVNARAAAISEAPNVEVIRLTQLGDEKCVPARLILKAAKKVELDHCVVIGRDQNGELWAESSMNAAQTLFLLERLKQRCLKGNGWSII